MSWVGVDIRLTSHPSLLLSYGVDAIRVLWNGMESSISIANHRGVFQIYENKNHLFDMDLLERNSELILLAMSSQVVLAKGQSHLRLTQSCQTPLPYLSCQGSSTLNLDLDYGTDSIPLQLLVTQYVFQPQAADLFITCTGRIALRPLPPCDRINQQNISKDAVPEAPMSPDSIGAVDNRQGVVEVQELTEVGVSLFAGEDSESHDSPPSLSDPDTFSTLSLPMPSECERGRAPLSVVITKPDVIRSEELRESKSVQTEHRPAIKPTVSPIGNRRNSTKVRILPQAASKDQRLRIRPDRKGGALPFRVDGYSSKINVVLKADEAPVPRLGGIQPPKKTFHRCELRDLKERPSGALDYATLLVPEPVPLEYSKVAN